MAVPAWLVHTLGYAVIARLLAGPVTVRVRASGVWAAAFFCALVSLSFLDGAGSNSGVVYACVWALAASTSCGR
jgi:hypothetical protein